MSFVAQNGTTDYLIMAFLIALVSLQLILLVYSTFIRKQDIFKFEQIDGFIMNYPEVDS